MKKIFFSYFRPRSSVHAEQVTPSISLIIRPAILTYILYSILVYCS